MGGLGRLAHADPGQADYPASRLLERAPVPTRTERYWYSGAWWGDQGDTPQCVAFAWDHYLADGPVTHTARPLIAPEVLYREAQAIDGISAPHDGTTTQAGAKVLQRRGLIASYWWATSIDDVLKALLTVGPVVLGVNWYASFDAAFEGPTDGKMVLRASSPVRGGHDIEADGVNVASGFVRLKQSWGRSLGDRGFGHIAIEDLDWLVFTDGGECCLASEVG